MDRLGGATTATAAGCAAAQLASIPELTAPLSTASDAPGRRPIQDQVPHGVLARVASWDTLTSFVTMPLGNALAGPLVHAFGLDRVLVGCALVLFGASVAPLFVSGSRQLTRPNRRDIAPPAAVPIEI